MSGESGFWRYWLRVAAMAAAFLPLAVCGSVIDLPEINERGVLRHLGVPYANFVTGAGDGLDVEVIQQFARHLGVRYEYVETRWKDVFGDLTGRHVARKGEGVELLDETPIRGDLISNGLTILPWRRHVVDFSTPTFPSGVWLIGRSDSPLRPISPTGEIDKDIAAVKASLAGHSVLALKNTCLDPGLYAMGQTQAEVRLLPGIRRLNEMVPAILKGDAGTTLLDVPDALIALEKWPGRIKIIGPISKAQQMAVGFRKTSPQLRAAFNTFFGHLKSDGRYNQLVDKYYPAVFHYYGDFFAAR